MHNGFLMHDMLPTKGHLVFDIRYTVRIVYAWMVMRQPELLGAGAHSLQPLIEHAIYYVSN